MKDLYSHPLMKWLERKGLSPQKRYDLVGILGFGCFMLAILVSIVVQGLDLCGWAKTLAAWLSLLLMLGFLAASGYFCYLANILWLFLVLFGVSDIPMALFIGLDETWSLIFLVVGIAITVTGGILAPRQLRNSKAIRQELNRLEEEELHLKRTKALEKQRQKKAAAAQKKAKAAAAKQPAPQPAPKPTPQPEAAPLDLLKNKLNSYSPEASQNKGLAKEEKEALKKKQAVMAHTLGNYLMEHPPLYVLICRFPGGSPVYMGTDGRMEWFTDLELAQKAQNILRDAMNVTTELRTLNTTGEIREFLIQCAHNGLTCLRLDNGGNRAELWLKDFFPYQEPELIDEKNRTLRGLFQRSKLYSWTLGLQKDQQSGISLSLAEMMLTTRLMGYQELGRTLVYALADPMPEDRVYVTKEAWEFFYDRPAQEDTPTYTGTLHLGFVNRPGEQGDVSKGSLCVFTDLPQAKAGQALFRQSGMDFSIVAITFEQMMSQAVQCAGIVVDMQTLGFEIPKAEYGKMDEVRKLPGPVVVSLKRKPKPVHTEMKGAWKQFDYQWPQRYGYDYMLASAQWLAERDLKPMTLVTAPIAGGGEQEHIEDFRACGGKLAECVGQEQGVLAVGGFSDSLKCMMKVYWFNQTSVFRVFTAGDVEQDKIDAFAQMVHDRKKPESAQ